MSAVLPWGLRFSGENPWKECLQEPANDYLESQATGGMLWMIIQAQTQTRARCFKAPAHVAPHTLYEAHRKHRLNLRTQAMQAPSTFSRSEPLSRLSLLDRFFFPQNPDATQCSQEVFHGISRPTSMLTWLHPKWGKHDHQKARTAPRQSLRDSHQITRFQGSGLELMHRNDKQASSTERGDPNGQRSKVGKSLWSRRTICCCARCSGTGRYEAACRFLSNLLVTYAGMIEALAEGSYTRRRGLREWGSMRNLLQDPAGLIHAALRFYNECKLVMTALDAFRL